MLLKPLPTIDIMIDLYEKPISSQRFKNYLKMLQGDIKDDLALPISGFNPMGKEHVLEKLKELKKLDAEYLIEEVLADVNRKVAQQVPSREFTVALNLSDDLKGGWTNHYTSDYNSKFKIKGLVNKNFCTPIFWTSEIFTTNVIKKRTLEYVFRTIYWLNNPAPNTLKEHLLQEMYVANEVNFKSKISQEDLIKFNEFYSKHKDTTNYHIIFNFFYGDKASKSLGFPVYGIDQDNSGFDYASQLKIR